ncbi:MAG: translation initiation factor IF-3 [Patescibacteria group bacterium]
MPNYRRRNTRPVASAQPDFKVNREIKAPELRLIDQEGEMIGVMSLSEALAYAQEHEMDLIEINPKAVPPVAKVMPYSKFKYQMQKKTDKQKAPKTELKNIRVSVRTSRHDLEVKAKKIVEFLEDGHKVRLDVNMRGREQQYPEIAMKQIKLFLEVVGVLREYGVESEPKLMGSRFTCTITPNVKASSQQAQ